MKHITNALQWDFIAMSSTSDVSTDTQTIPITIKSGKPKSK